MTRADPPYATHIRLLGDFSLIRADGRTVGMTNRRARALLGYLALEPEHAAPRERLAGLLWSDRPEPQARASLRQCLLELRGLLAAEALDLLEAGRERVSLDVGALSSDVAELQAALANEDVETAADQLAAAGRSRVLEDVDIGGLFGDWLDQVRARLDQTLAKSVQSLIARLEWARDWAKVDRLAEAWLRRDPLDETVVAAAMRADAARGAASAARRRYQILESSLARDLGVRPGAAAREALANLHSVPGAPALAPPRRNLVTPPARPSIAVMPFRNISGAADQEYLADAISEDVIAALSRWRWVFVVAASSTFTYKGRNVEAKRVGAELGVRYVLEGSVRRAGDRVRIAAQLVDAGNEWAVWADRFDGHLAGALALQDEIVEQVVAAIEPAVLQTEGARATPKALADASALDCFYRGMWRLNQVSREGSEAAEPLFREAVAREPELSLGHIGLARTLFGRAIYGWSDRPTEDLLEACAAAQVAIGLDGGDAWAHCALAGGALYLGDHMTALTAARTAVKLNPSFAVGQVRLGQVLVFVGRPQEAIAPIERALRLSPYDPQLGLGIELLSLAHYQARDYEKAAHRAREALEQGNGAAALMLAVSLAQLGRREEAARALASARPRAPPRGRLTPPYAHTSDRNHFRDGLRLARTGLPQAEVSLTGGRASSR